LKSNKSYLLLTKTKHKIKEQTIEFYLSEQSIYNTNIVKCIYNVKKSPVFLLFYLYCFVLFGESFNISQLRLTMITLTSDVQQTWLASYVII